MWYNLDLKKFARTLLPPLLRGTVLIALLNVLVAPIRDIYDRFMRYRSTTSHKIKKAANVIYLEKTLNELFYLRQRQIRIETLESDGINYFHNKTEDVQPNFFYNDVKHPFFIGYPDDVSVEPTFVIYIPTFLCTDLDTSKDKFKGRYLAEIYNLLDFYKPAGRGFCIELYEYE